MTRGEFIARLPILLVLVVVQAGLSCYFRFFLCNAAPALHVEPTANVSDSP
jgi:hypothetical protein